MNVEQAIWDGEVTSIEELREKLKSIVADVKSLSRGRERSLVATKIDEAILWLGADLDRLAKINPYKPEETI